MGLPAYGLWEQDNLSGEINQSSLLTWLQLTHVPLVPLYVWVNCVSIGSDNDL